MKRKIDTVGNGKINLVLPGEKMREFEEIAYGLGLAPAAYARMLVYADIEAKKASNNDK